MLIQIIKECPLHCSFTSFMRDVPIPWGKLAMKEKDFERQKTFIINFPFQIKTSLVDVKLYPLCNGLYPGCHKLYRICHKLYRTCHKLYRICHKLYRICHKMYHLCNKLYPICCLIASTTRLPLLCTVYMGSLKKCNALKSVKLYKNVQL